MTIPMRQNKVPAPSTIEDVLIRGDLSALTAEQRTEYYMRVCNSLGLNPLTQPFAFILLNGKLVMYALRACADQLRKINGISIEIVSQELRDGLLTVHVRAKDKSGRTDEDLGVVATGHLKGEAAANGILKAVTKAKRRVTLSISGLGYLDETEIEDIPARAKGPDIPADNIIQPKVIAAPTHDPETGELGPHEIAIPQGDKGDDWIGFGSLMLAAVKEAETDQKITEWIAANMPTIDAMAKAAPKVHKRLMAAIEQQAKSFVAPSIPLIDEDPEGFHTWLREQCLAVKSMSALDKLATSIEPMLDKGFPPDIEHATDLIAKRREVLKKGAK